MFFIKAPVYESSYEREHHVTGTEVFGFQHTSESLICVYTIQILSFISFPEIYVQTRRVVIALNISKDGIGASEN